MAELRERLRGRPALEESAEAVDRTAQLWFAEAVELIRLRRQGREQEAIRRINQGLSEARFTAFRARAHPAAGADRAGARRRAGRRTTAAAC